MEGLYSGKAGPALAYDGRIGELYRIFLVNLLLTVLTLGIWRFWAVTRLRRYVWSRTSHDGDRFEYDGTGGQLFVGFLLAVCVLAGLFAAASAAQWALMAYQPRLAPLPLGLLNVCILVLALGARFSAQRYRLNHTIWRGVHGGMTGSMITYGLRSWLYYLLVGLTFGQLWPWASLRLLEQRINASSFGSIPFEARGRPGVLYLRFLGTCLGVVALAAVVFGLAFMVELPIIQQARAAFGRPEASVFVRQLSLAFGLAFVVVLVGGALISALYQAAFYRHIRNHTRFGGLRFSSGVTGLQLLGLTLGNLAIVVLTLGLGLPIVIHRNARFFARHLLAEGTLDTSAMLQSGQAPSRFGEGMFQALDAGVSLT